VAEGAGPCRHRWGLAEEQVRLLDEGGRIPLITLSLIRDFELSLVASGMAGADWVASESGFDLQGSRAGCRLSQMTGVSAGEAVYWWRGEPGDRLRLGELALTWPDGRKENPRHEPLGPAYIYTSSEAGAQAHVGDPFLNRQAPGLYLRRWLPAEPAR